MSQAVSTLLNAIRLLAALVVFATHASQFLYPETYHAVTGIGHSAVIVFFVLSGFVIAHSVGDGSRGYKHYALARLSRLYSVVLPALALTVILQTIGTLLNPAYYQDFSRGSDALRVVLGALFLQEMWGFSASPPTNLPLWSLGYEFWYYAIYGAAVFIPSVRWRLAAVTGLLLIAGPKVLLLMPIWLMGVAAYRLADKVRLSRMWAHVGLCLCTAGIAWTFLLPEWPFKVGGAPLFYSAAYLSDNLCGIFCAAWLWFVGQALGRFSIAPTMERSIQRAADITFSLYLYHYPLLVFVTAVVPFNARVPWHAALVVGGILLAIVALSIVSEARRHWWHRLIALTWDWVAMGSRRVATQVMALFHAHQAP